MGVLSQLAVHTGKEAGLKRFGYRASFSLANPAVIQFTYGGDFCRRTREKRFIRRIEFIPRQPFFNELDAQIQG